MPARGDVKSVGGEKYQWNGRRWVPARSESAPAPRQQSASEQGFDARRAARTGRNYSQNFGATAQPPESSGGSVTRVGGKVYKMGDPAQVEALNQVLAADEATRPGQQFADIRGGGGLKADGSGRHTAPPRQNPNGVQQSGTRMGPPPMTMDDANRLLTGGYTVQNPFTSNALPATSASAYQQDNPETNFNRELPEDMFSESTPLTLTDNVFEAGSGLEYGVDIPRLPATGKVEYEQQAGAPLTVGFGAIKASSDEEAAVIPETVDIPARPKGGRQLENWERKYGRMQQPVEREKSDLEKGFQPDMDRRRAFLDAENSLQGLRRVEAQKGVVVAGGQYNLVNPKAGEEGQNDFITIDKEKRDTIMRGGEGAQNLLNSYVSDISEDNSARTDYSFDSPDVEDPDESIQGTTADLPKNWRKS